MAKVVVVERDDTGRVFKVPVGPWVTQRRSLDATPKHSASSSPWSANAIYTGLGSLYHVLSELFLPAGYPSSVSPGMYQIYNALQAFCNSLSGLLASRGALEGVGVGDASTSATHALLLTVLKDIFSRFTTILAAYYFGTSLYPETKTFRYLADVFNDAATVLDTIVPFIGSIDPSRYWSALPSGATLQIIALCLSSGMRSLCLLVAGGSKAALKNHFASPLAGKGDVGEVSAKDESRETVVGLSGILLGTLLIPYVNTRALTYTTLFILVGAHLLFNYLAVRSVVLRTLNRQRACILWTSFKLPTGTFKERAPTPANIASKELLFGAPSTLREASTGRKIGRCILGTSLQNIKSQCTAEHIESALHVFGGERYVLFIVGGNDHGLRQGTIAVCFKDGYHSIDQLQAWIHAIEATRRLCDPEDDADLVDVLRSTLPATREAIPRFVQSLAEAGWETGNGSMMFGSPSHLILGIDKDQEDTRGDDEDKKQR
ncbi:vitamin B6 photo-protection and homoeostasis-domain-containing protein [Boletus reticuloceps]|uniref:Vitamin B6 photo-protection and homoeostasis-domain-containing protein n=1 Tax=Boletus reticuloceps TaxID=495285 RepID=A0A8I3A5W1_9AGAM|nr:vitamin B6 photo-protection and homoeostasis-domain-containing protein [Boletus reticuloceps]